MASAVSHEGPDEQPPADDPETGDRGGLFEASTRPGPDDAQDDASDDAPDDAPVQVDAQALLAGLVEPPPAGGPDLSGVPLQELVGELARRQRSATRLLKEQQRLRARLAEIDKELATLVPSAPAESAPAPVATPYRKPIADLTLAEAMARLFEIGDEFSPSDAAERLLDAGFPTRAANFRQIVSQTLTRERRFRRVAHGVYQRTA